MPNESGDLGRVRLFRGHPWSGHSGRVTVQATDHIEVTLDNGQRVFAYPGQWRRVTHTDRTGGGENGR